MKLNYLLLMAALTVAVHALLTHTGAQTGLLETSSVARTLIEPGNTEFPLPGR